MAEKTYRLVCLYVSHDRYANRIADMVSLLKKFHSESTDVLFLPTDKEPYNQLHTNIYVGNYKTLKGVLDSLFLNYKKSS